MSAFISRARRRLRRACDSSKNFATRVNPSQAVDVARTIERIVALLRGERVDLSTVPLDMTGIDKFDRDVYVAAREIRAGDTRTYGEIAKRLGRPEAARDVASHSLAIHSPSWCPVIAWSPPTERPVVSRRAAV